MTPELKIEKSYRIIFDDYCDILGHDAVGLYYHIIWFHSQSLGKNVTFSYIKDRVRIEEESLKKLIKKMIIFKLLSKKRVDNEWELVPSVPKKMTKEEKIDRVNKMFKKVLISSEEKDYWVKYIEENYDEEVETEIDEISKHNVDIGIPTRRPPGPDTNAGLVITYYQMLGKIFGGQYYSRNLLIEAKHLGECMKKNGDTPEKTREFFEWILKKAKEKGKFDKVSSLGLYPEFRKSAYYNLYVKKEGNKKFDETDSIPSSGTKILSDMKNVFSIYKNDGMDTEEIVENILKKNFDQQYVDKFVETLNAK